MLRKGLFSLLLAAMMAASVFADTVIQKPPDLGLAYEPLSNTGVFVYADSFVAPANDTVVTDLGVWLIPLFGGSGAVVALQVWGEDPNTGGPNPQDVIASTDDFATALPGMNLHSLPVTRGHARLRPAQRYWFVATAVGRQGDGGYGLGGHTQNSVVQDNGTLWTSDDPNGLVFNAQNQLPEIAYEVRLQAPIVPAMFTTTALLFGLFVLIATGTALRKRQSRFTPDANANNWT